MTIHKEGKATLLLALLLFVAINGVVWYFCSSPVGQIVTALTVVPLALVINFFRRPQRHKVVVPGSIVAPCDGTVVAIEEVFEPEFLKCQTLQVSIFMSLFNVHMNWYPVGGTVIYYRHHDGKKAAAYLPKSSTDNERSSVVIASREGVNVLVRQVAGAMARRVVSYMQEGDTVKQSDDMGFIKFGSRVDMYLPLGTQIDVKLKDEVTGSQTVLGWLK